MKEIRSADWDGRDLSGEHHEQVTFADVDMTETSSHGAVFTGSRCVCTTHASG